jgi:hypothetical protein
MPDNQRDPGHFLHQLLQCLSASQMKCFPQQQINRRIAGQRQFRRNNQICAGLFRLLRRFKDSGRITGDITYRKVDLRNRNFHKY